MNSKQRTRPSEETASPTPPSVAIIVLNWNGLVDTRACLHSLLKIDYFAAHIVVVDNGSSDDSVVRIRAEFPAVTLIETGVNLGYAGGNNVGIRHALAQGFDYILLLNNDTEVAPDFLDVLVAYCETHPEVGAVGPKIYLYDYPDRLWSAGGVIEWRQGARTHMRGLQEVDRGQFDTAAQVDFLPGCAVLVRSEILPRVGLIDERFGMYYEETEWCVRMARAGVTLVYVPEAHLWHKVQVDRQNWSPQITYYMVRNRLLFLRLTRAPLISWLYAIVLQDVRTWISWRIRPKWQGRGPQRSAMWRGWTDFLNSRFGMVRFSG